MAHTDYLRPHAQLHLALFQGFSPSYEWDLTEDKRDYYDFDQYLRLVQTAERGLFSTVFLGESLRLREHLGTLNDIKITGRPDALVLFSYLAANTTNIGLVSTLNTTYSDVADLARRIGTLDVLSAGRAGWNIVTTDNAWTGENFRKGGFLPNAERYHNAEEYVAAVQAVWDGWGASAPARSGSADSWAGTGQITPVSRRGRFHNLDLVPRVPRSPQGQPIYFQAGDSPQGRDFAARRAEGIFSRHGEFNTAVAFAADIRRRARSYGRAGEEIKIFPAGVVVVAETDKEAQDKARHYIDYTFNDRQVYQSIEAVWGEDLSHVDIDGPLPDFDPLSTRQSRTHGIVHSGDEPLDKATEWRGIAEANGFTIRQLVKHEFTNTVTSFVGSPDTVADDLAHHVRSDAFDGLNVSPFAFPDGLDDIVDLLVPELQNRGVYPESYAGSTLRENLGLPESVGRRIPELARLNAEPRSA